MGTLLRLLQVKLRATDSHIMTMLHEIAYTLLEVQQTGTSLDQCDVIHREGTLQGCHLKEFVQQYVRISIALYIHDDTHTLTTRLVIDISNTLNLVLVGEFSDIGNKVGLIDTIRNLRHNNLIMGIATLNLSLGTHHNTSTSCLIGIFHTL